MHGTEEKNLQWMTYNSAAVRCNTSNGQKLTTQGNKNCNLKQGLVSKFLVILRFIYIAHNQTLYSYKPCCPCCMYVKMIFFGKVDVDSDHPTRSHASKILLAIPMSKYEVGGKIRIEIKTKDERSNPK